MRSRFVIPAALLVAAAYVKGRLDGPVETGASPAPSSDPPALTPEMLRAEAEAADAMVIAQMQTAATVATPPAPERDLVDLSAASEWVTTPGTPAAAPPRRDEWEAALAEWVAAPAPVVAPVPPVAAPAPVEVPIVESGRFSLGGWATQPGHVVLCGVTFRDRRGEPVDAGAIRLVLEADANVAQGGLVVLSDAGFAPDREGFTILVAAAAAGAFAATGRYELVAA